MVESAGSKITSTCQKVVPELRDPGVLTLDFHREVEPNAQLILVWPELTFGVPGEILDPPSRGAFVLALFDLLICRGAATEQKIKVKSG